MTKPLISYYGDDFTGSTDVMEALASNGVETVLFAPHPVCLWGEPRISPLTLALSP